MNFMVICVVGVCLLLEASIVGVHWRGGGLLSCSPLPNQYLRYCRRDDLEFEKCIFKKKT